MQTTLLIFLQNIVSIFNRYIFSDHSNFSIILYQCTLWLESKSQRKLDLRYFSPIVFVWLQNFDATKILWILYYESIIEKYFVE